ncbi:MAG: CRTAC1 family protein [Planctomycetota bacterium]|nr:CRTAC1 family protein [Planctomycetota bacterium]
MTALVQPPLCRLAAELLIAAVVAGSLLCGCQQQPAPEPEPIATLPQIEGPADPAVRFADEAEARGVRFTAVNGEEVGNLAILESLGCGVGLIDVDGDADLDLFAVGGGRFADGSCTPVAVDDGLFRNDGNGMFTASSEQAGILRGTFYAHGVEVGDFDSDGFSDLLITGYDGLRLLANMGDGSFREVPAEEHGMASDGWHSTAAAADFNHDGHLDLYCVRYVDWSPDNNPPCVVQGHRDVCPPGEFGGVTDRLWISDGAGGFREAAATSGVVEGGKGLGAVAADIDLDGHTDLYVANDTTPNRLYRNGGDGTLAECGLVAGVALGETGEPEGSMGTDVGDANLDGLPDLWVANFESQSFGLYRNFGGATFEHASGVSGITAVGAVYVGFGTMFLDADLDGAEDLFVANGHVMQFPTLTPLKQRPLLFRNLGSGRFANVADTAGDYFQQGHMGRGAAAGDLDGDGDDDIVVSQTNEPLAVLINTSATVRQPLVVQLVGTQTNRDAIGGTAILTTDRRRLLRQVKGGGSYLSAGSRALAWGLADKEKPLSLAVRWPGGELVELPWGKATGRYLIREGARGATPGVIPVDMAAGGD